MVNPLISAGAAMLISSVKNPAKRAGLKDICLALFNAIKFAFAGDPDFQ